MDNNINLQELQEFMTKEKVTFARTASKKMNVLLNGTIQIWIKDSDMWVLNWQGIQPFSAIEKYNSLP